MVILWDQQGRAPTGGSGTELHQTPGTGTFLGAQVEMGTVPDQTGGLTNKMGIDSRLLVR